jgi:hypothetical protein
MSIYDEKQAKLKQNLMITQQKQTKTSTQPQTTQKNPTIT